LHFRFWVGGGWARIKLLQLGSHFFIYNYFSKLMDILFRD